MQVRITAVTYRYWLVFGNEFIGICGPCLHGAISVCLVSQWCDVNRYGISYGVPVLVKYVEGTDTELLVSMSQRSIELTVKVLKNYCTVRHSLGS